MKFFVMRLSLLVFLLIGAGEASAFTACNTQIIDANASRLPNEGLDPVVVGTNVYAAYARGSQLIVEVSHDAGNTYSAVRIDDALGVTSLPRIAAYKDYVYISWTETKSANKSIYFTHSEDDGRTFTKARKLDAGFGPQISASALKVVVGFIGSAGSPELFVSADGGRSFAAPVTLSGPAGHQQELALASRANNVYAVWEDSTAANESLALMAYSHDGGVTFSAAKSLSPSQTYAVEPLIAISGDGTVSIVWRTSKDPTAKNRLSYIRSTDLAQSFSKTVILDDNVRHGSVVADGANLYVSYLKQIGNDWETQFRASHDKGQTFSAPVNLSGISGINQSPDTDDFLPAMWAGNGALTLAWTSASSAYVQSSGDGGTSFSPPTYLGPGNSVLPGGPFVLWLDSQSRPNLANCR